MSKSEAKERSVFNKICSILIDIFIVPVILIAFVCAILMTSAKAHNKVPSVLGNSIVEVLTPSMAVEGGYFPGDVLIIDQNVNKDDLKVGDCIAFYAPKASGWVYDNGESKIIFHRIVRILKTTETIDGKEIETKYFVCRGDAEGSLSANADKEGCILIPTEEKLDGLPEEEWGGDYDENGNIKENGGYVVKLTNDQSKLQYVTEEFVVGKLKSRAGGFISALVKFCCSEVGIILLVIIPSLIMIAMVTSNIVQESRLAKAERESGQVTMAKNISMINNIDEDNKDKSSKQEENVEQKVEQNVTKDKVADIQKTLEESKKINATKPDVKEIKNEPIKKETPKVAQGNIIEPKTTVKPAEPKTPEVKPTAPKAPAKPSAVKEVPKAPTAPKVVPVKKEAPKVPAKEKVEQPKAPTAPKVAPKVPTAPKAPAKVPPKKG